VCACTPNSRRTCTRCGWSATHSSYEFCAQEELPSTLAILCDLDMNDPMARRRVMLAVERIVSGR
jgi:hypothetical protein